MTTTCKSLWDRIKFWVLKDRKIVSPNKVKSENSCRGQKIWVRKGVAGTNHRISSTQTNAGLCHHNSCYPLPDLTFCFLLFKYFYLVMQSWRDSSVVMSICCSGGGPGFSSQLLVTPVPGPDTLLGLCRHCIMCCAYKHTNKSIHPLYLLRQWATKYFNTVN